LRRRDPRREKPFAGAAERMNTIQHIRFPDTTDVVPLYLRLSGPADLRMRGEGSSVLLGRGATISLNTYFNSFFEKPWIRHTSLRSLTYLIRLRGDLLVRVLRETRSGERTVLDERRIDHPEALGQVGIRLPEHIASAGEPGRVYLEMTCLGDQAEFAGGRLVTEQEPATEVVLGVVCVTYKREPFIRALIERWTNDGPLREKQAFMIVVDNGGTLDSGEFPDKRLGIVANRNTGGSGGFNRGLREAVDRGGFTHYLLLDDDILLEPEAIFRLISFYEYATGDPAVAGALLDIDDKMRLFEAAARVGGIYSRRARGFFTFTLCHHNLRLDRPADLNSLLSENDPDCSGFWFFGFPASWVAEAGLLLPFFLHGDDIEFGLRLKFFHGKKILALPSLGVWHHIFVQDRYFQEPYIQYYDIRNMTILYFIYDDIPCDRIIKALTRALLALIAVFDYRQAAYLVMGLRDAVVGGPHFLETTDPEVFHNRLLGLFDSYAETDPGPAPPLFSDRLPDAMPPRSFWARALAALTLFGHLLPDFFLKDGTVRIPPNRGSNVFPFKRVTYVARLDNRSRQYRMRRLVGIRLFMEWISVCWQAAFLWERRKRDWRAARPGLTSLSAGDRSRGLKPCESRRSPSDRPVRA